MVAQAGEEFLLGELSLTGTAIAKRIHKHQQLVEDRIPKRSNKGPSACSVRRSPRQSDVSRQPPGAFMKSGGQPVVGLTAGAASTSCQPLSCSRVDSRMVACVGCCDRPSACQAVMMRPDRAACSGCVMRRRLAPSSRTIIRCAYTMK